MKVDFLNKEFVKSFFIDNHNYFYSFAANADGPVMEGKEWGFMETVLNSQGREYIKTGKFCIQTLVGNIYKTFDTKTNATRYILLVGLSKQNPSDLIHNKKVAIETAQEYACTEPVMTILLDHCPGFHEFRDYAIPYLKMAKQKFVMTAQEKEVAIGKQYSHFINKD